jgi:hypothetical protein
VSSALLDEIERLIAATGDADDVLRDTVSALVAEPGITWAGIGFVEGDEVKLGPASGTPNEARRARVGVVFEGSTVGELWADGDVDETLLEGVASRIASQVLIGWDTGGVAWVP